MHHLKPQAFLTRLWRQDLEVEAGAPALVLAPWISQCFSRATSRHVRTRRYYETGRFPRSRPYQDSRNLPRRDERINTPRAYIRWTDGTIGAALPFSQILDMRRQDEKNGGFLDVVEEVESSSAMRIYPVVQFKTRSEISKTETAPNSKQFGRSSRRPYEESGMGASNEDPFSKLVEPRQKRPPTLPPGKSFITPEVNTPLAPQGVDKREPERWQAWSPISAARTQEASPTIDDDLLSKFAKQTDSQRRDEKIDTDWAHFRLPDGSLGEPVLFERILQMRKRDPDGKYLDFIQELAPPDDKREYPVVKVTNWQEFKDMEKAQKKALKNSKLVEKRIEFSWRVEGKDLDLRLGKMQDFLRKGARVEVMIGSRRLKGSSARKKVDMEEALVLIEKVRKAAREVDKVIESAAAQGDICREYMLTFRRSKGAASASAPETADLDPESTSEMSHEDEPVAAEPKMSAA